jgi:hypothetical protein
MHRTGGSPPFTADDAETSNGNERKLHSCNRTSHPLTHMQRT